MIQSLYLKNQLKILFYYKLQKFASKCPPGIRLIAFNSTEKEIMLETLNSYRSTLALGGASNVSESSLNLNAFRSNKYFRFRLLVMLSLQPKTCINS